MNHVFKILKFTSHLWPMYLIVSIFSVLLALMNLAIPLFSGMAIDELQLGTEASFRYVFLLALAIFGLDLGATFVSNIGGHVGDQMAAKLHRALATRYYEHLLKLPQSYFDTELSGKIIGRLNRSIEQIVRFMQMMSNNFLQFIFTTVLSLAVVAFFSVEVALLLFALYPIFIYMTVRSSSTWQDYQKQKNENLDIANGRFAEAINQMKVLKSFIQEKNELSFFDSHIAKVVSIDKPQSKFWHIEDVKRRLALNLIFLGVYSFIFYRGTTGDLTPGEAVTLILYAAQIRIPIFTISFLVENTQRAIADSKDYFEIMSLPAREELPVKSKRLSVKEGNIKFADVDFTYDGGKQVLKKLNITIPAQKTTALVGESGQGKTTITNLLMRLYLPTSGTISIDSQNILDLPLDNLRANIGVVFQDPSLFSGTIRENIAYSDPKASIEAVEQAAKAANAHEFVSELKDGYKTQIGERGLKLSGGQKQRIAIARALLKDAPILILDEATSSLDSRSEALVQEALQRLMKNRTTVIIAHRLSTIQNVDQIITLKNGTVDEVGSPSELAKTSGLYARLLKLQSGHTKQNKKQLKEFEIVA